MVFKRNRERKYKPSNIYSRKKQIKLHGHCHQKELSSIVVVKKVLSFPKIYSVELVPSGCCGMAGAFGTSCGHQIKDGTGKIAQHSIEILFDALV